MFLDHFKKKANNFKIDHPTSLTLEIADIISITESFIYKLIYTD